jgi:hypothetical protein
MHPELPPLIARIEAMGLAYRRAKYADDDDEQDYFATDEFLCEVDHLREVLDELELYDEIARQPSQSELHAVHIQLYDVIMNGEWNGTEDSLKELLFRIVPQIVVHR